MSSLHPVSVSRHGARYWQRSPNYAFAAGDALCSLVVQELPRAALSLAIAFVAEGEEIVPVALQGVQPGSNLYVMPDGRWLGGYVPAAYRGYPFVLATAEDEGGRQVLCFDEDSGLLSDEPGEAFFVEGSQPSKAVADVLDFLGQVASNRQVTRRICAKLKEYGLVQPWPLKVQSERGEQALAGLLRIDEAALNALSAEQLVALRDAGALPVIYCQLLSMQHVAQLGPLAQAQAQAGAQQADPAASTELDLEFLNKSETLSFSGI